MDATVALGERLEIGQQVTVDIEKIAHGGHCVARYEGQVIFVRYAIPGERALVEITAVNSKMARGDAISIVSPSEHRREAPCQYAHPGGCGGCDFQHIDLGYQRELKKQVIVEQFLRLGGVDVTCEVKAVAPLDGLHWRTRMDFAIGESGRIGLFGSRSNEVIEIQECLIADPAIDVSTLSKRRWNGEERVEVATTSTGQVSVTRAGRSISGPTQLVEKVDGFTYQISPLSFWQAHKSAPSTLISEVISKLELEAGEVVCDLYGGVGLFTAPIAAKVGARGKVHLIESDRRAVADAQKIFKGVANVEIHAGTVESRLPRISDPDVILLDPPRTGAGEEVVTVMTRTHPRAIVYVSCDPASLARDAKLLLESGYRMDFLVGYDLFPQTQHVECVARFIPV